MEMRLETKKAERLLVAGRCVADKGKEMVRITSELNSSYWIAASKTPPRLFPGRFKQVEVGGEQVYVNLNSLKKRLSLTDREIKEADDLSGLIRTKLQTIQTSRSPNSTPPATALEFTTQLHPTDEERSLLQSRRTGIIQDQDQWYLIDRNNAGVATTFVRLEEKLGKGAFGTVQAGVDLINNKRVAVKIANGKGEDELTEEFRAYRKMGDKSVTIVTASKIMEGKNYICLIMERMDGDLTQARSTLSKEQREKAVVAMWQELGKLHAQGISHRDIKLENILYRVDERGEVAVKIVDPAFAIWQGHSPAGLRGTDALIKADDERAVYDKQGEITAPNLLRGMDLFALTVDSIRLLSGTQLSTGRGGMNSGDLPCTRERFLGEAGISRKMEATWNTLVALHAASLTERSEPGKAQAVAQQLAEHLT